MREKILSVSYWILVSLLIVGLGGCAGLKELVVNGAMEGIYVRGLAPEWCDDSTGYTGDETTFSFQEEKDNPHSGSSCQKITCTSYGRGPIGIDQHGLSIKKGATYRVNLWLRQEGIEGEIIIGLEEAESPWRLYAGKKLPVTPAWGEYQFTLTSGGDDLDSRILIRFEEEGTLWIDDVSVKVLEK